MKDFAESIPLEILRLISALINDERASNALKKLLYIVFRMVGSKVKKWHRDLLNGDRTL